MRIVSNDIEPQLPSGQSDEHLAAELVELRARLERLGTQIAHTMPATSGVVHSLIRARAVRLQLFEEGLFADPSWDMLLHLYAQELDHRRVAVSKLCQASAVPAATALRHIGVLERRGLITRSPDERDARRIWVELSPAGSAAMRRYFQWLSEATRHGRMCAP